MKKKNIFIVCMALFMSVQANAQEDSISTRYSELENRVTALEENARLQKIWDRQSYFNIGYVSQSLKDDVSGDKLKNSFGVFLARGNTYYLHSKPLWGVVKIGLDWTQLDLNYVKYKNIDFYTLDGENTITTHQFEYSMHIGPSITVNPVDFLLVNVYGRYAPTFSGIYSKNGDKHVFGPSYVSYFIFGGAVSYKVISLGVETRFGSGKFKMQTFDKDSESISLKKKMHSTRVYLSLRF